MTRRLSAIGFLICIAALGAAYFLEYQYMLAVCPLCILQRIVFYALAGTFLFGIIFNFQQNIWKKIYAGIIALFSICGILLATRQVWLQYFAPPQTVSCSASLERLIAVHPFFDALKIAIIGSGECAEIDFSIFGISIAGWSLLLFTVILINGLLIGFKKP